MPPWRANFSTGLPVSSSTTLAVRERTGSGAGLGAGLGAAVCKLGSRGSSFCQASLTPQATRMMASRAMPQGISCGHFLEVVEGSFWAVMFILLPDGDWAIDAAAARQFQIFGKTGVGRGDLS